MATKKQPVQAPAPKTLTSQLPCFDTRDTSGRHAIDMLLRKWDWTIHSRPKGKQPLWKHHSGQVLPQKDALKTLDANDVDDAFYMQSLYYGMDEDVK